MANKSARTLAKCKHDAAVIVAMAAQWCQCCGALKVLGKPTWKLPAWSRQRIREAL